MAQPPFPNNRRSLRADLIDGAKRRWVIIGGGLMGLVAILAITPVLFSPAAPAVQRAGTPTVIVSRSTQLPPTKIIRSAAATYTSVSVATPALPDTLVEARVVRVVDGDTLEVEVSERKVVVQLEGVSAPGLSPSECFGREATNYIRAMVDSWGERVWLERDVSEDDGEGRLLRYVWLEMQGSKRMLNEALLEGGFAKAKVSEPDTRYKDRFLTVEYDAQVAKRGLWGICGEVSSPLPTQEPTTLPTTILPTPTPPLVPPTVPPTLTSSPTVEASPTTRPSRLPSPSSTATRTRVAPSPTKPASATAIPTRTATQTVKPVVPTASPTIAKLPTTAPTQPAPSPTSLPQQTPEPQPQPTATSIPTVPLELPQPTATTVTNGLRYDPNGPDRDCPDFDTWEEAQAFFIAAGGPERDPHRLDGDNDGIACENLRK